MSSDVPKMNFQAENPNITDEKDAKNLYDDEHVEAAAVGDRSDGIIAKDFSQYVHDASEAIDGQKAQSVRQALSRWRKGVLYSVIFSR